MKKTDLKILYYPQTTKGHPVAVILFYEDMDLNLGFDRVMLRFDCGRLYFEEAEEGHGLRLNNSRIQVWGIADKLMRWEGCYTLRFNIERSQYFIDLEDREELDFDKREGSRLGTSLQYTKHCGVSKPKKVEESEDIAMNNEEEKVETNSEEKEMCKVLIDRLLSSLDKKEYDKAKAFAISARSFLE